MFLCQLGMAWNHAYIVSDGAAFFWLKFDVVAIRAVLFTFCIGHWHTVLASGQFISDLAINEFNTQIVRGESICTYPRMNIDTLTEAELSFTTPIHIQF